MDAMTPSLDDPIFQGGVPFLVAVDSTSQLGSMTGDVMEATFLLPNMELVPGRESRVSQVRCLTDATDGVTVALTSRARLGDTGSTDSFATLQEGGGRR
jgi:hypothetical protein